MLKRTLSRWAVVVGRVAFVVLVVPPGLAFVRFSAWARLTVSTRAFRAGLMSRTEHERDLQTVEQLRASATRLWPAFRDAVRHR